MSINDPYAAASVRRPQLQILNNGSPVGGALSFCVHSNSYYQSDTFSAEFAFNADPNYGLAFWGDTSWDRDNPLLLDIQASLDGGDTFTSLILGQVDRVSAHLDKGIVRAEGRDRAAVFIDSKVQTTFLNQTASQIVETLAAEHGLIADVTPTNTLVGRYYDIA